MVRRRLEGVGVPGVVELGSMVLRASGEVALRLDIVLVWPGGIGELWTGAVAVGFVEREFGDGCTYRAKRLLKSD